MINLLNLSLTLIGLHDSVQFQSSSQRAIIRIQVWKRYSLVARLHLTYQISSISNAQKWNYQMIGPRSGNRAWRKVFKLMRYLSLTCTPAIALVSSGTLKRTNRIASYDI